MHESKVHSLRKRRPRSWVKVLAFITCGALLILCLRIGTGDTTVASRGDNNSQCNDGYEKRRQKEESYIIYTNFANTFKGRGMETPINEYSPQDLNGTPVIKDGLYTDQQDLDKPRPGEKYVTFAEYLECLSARLRVDYHQQREDTLTDDELRMSFPYVLSMVTVDLSDMKAVMCNVTVPIQRMTYVVNADIKAVHNFFHDVEKAFSFTKRVHVHWPGYNMGFAGAVNFGMRDALRYTFDEVPFFFILNNDIRFPEETLRKSLPEFRRVTLQDKKLLKGLREEVAKEPSEYTPKDRRHPLLRSSDNSTLLVTSTALPDRIRYMPYASRKKIFEKHYGGLFFDDKNDTAAFGMSRLAIETVGFMDENFYPAYYEDTDWRYRQARLGFSNFYMKGVPFFTHFVNSLLKVSTRHNMRPERATEAEVFAKSAEHFIRSFFNDYHLKKKYEIAVLGARDPFPWCHELPLDAWVMDIKRRAILIEAYTASRTFFSQTVAERRGKDTGHLLGWLPKAERHRLLSEFPGDSFSAIVSRGFLNNTLVRHSTR